MKKKQAVLECVPNFSHGKADSILLDIIQSINKVSGQKLLHVDNNLSANRTVITFAGNPEAIVHAAFEVIKIASEKIDMRFQHGAHPRIGAIDVFPLVPLYNISMEDTMKYAEQLAKKVGNVLNIPVYLYEFSAHESYRKSLPQIRKGGYEGLPVKMKDKKWQPDFGPILNEQTKASIEKTGAMVLGARNILVAFNISLNTGDKSIAEKIARKIRSSGYWKYEPQTNIREFIPGIFPELRAIGWYIDDFETAQVSMNLLDHKITSPVMVWETVEKLAHEYGCDALGCEVIGLIPEICILEAGVRFLYLKNKDVDHGDKDKLIKLGIEYLGLDKVKPFDPQKKVLEYALKNAGLLLE